MHELRVQQNKLKSYELAAKDYNGGNLETLFRRSELIYKYIFGNEKDEDKTGK